MKIPSNCDVANVVVRVNVAYSGVDLFIVYHVSCAMFMLCALSNWNIMAAVRRLTLPSGWSVLCHGLSVCVGYGVFSLCGLMCVPCIVCVFMLCALSDWNIMADINLFLLRCPLALTDVVMSTWM